MADSGEGTRAAEIDAEQAVVDGIYSQLDSTREHVRYRLKRALNDPIAGTPGSVNERDAMVTGFVKRLGELNGVDDRLCFGRLDMLGGDRRYIGRIGLSDSEHNILLMDWRADAAAAFYQATAADPMNVIRRRHISTSGHEVNSIDDDVLMIDELSNSDLASVTGSDSLLTALDAARTGHMRDIVATIQGEQDVIIRSDANGVLVVEGGPGTGKTIVALHRVAYLLYSHRERIARSGALVVGPNQAFLHYIDRVLPALGETGVVMKTLDEFVPGVKVTGRELPAAAILKGRSEMATLIKNVVQLWQRVPARSVTIDYDGTSLVMRPDDFAASVRRARDTGLPHNEARNVYAKDALRRLARKLAAKLSMDTDDETLTNLVADLRENRNVKREINLVWLPQTPTGLLQRVFSDPDLLKRAAPDLSAAEVETLIRPADSPWTTSDIPLLDEAAELLGELQLPSRHGHSQAEDQRQLAYARAALEASGIAASMMTAADYAKRFSASEELAPVAERAEADRGWTYGHVVVDEAQDLTAMQWRMVMRRCPTRSMTIVGDPAQASLPGAVADWSVALQPYVEQRWRHQRLSINYRTPERIMSIAALVHDRAGLRGQVSHAVRPGRWPVEVCESNDYLAALGPLLAEETKLLGEGAVVVVGPQAILALAEPVIAEQRSLIDRPDVMSIHALDPTTVKGLEFDSVILLEPAAWNPDTLGGDLYVTLSRATARLVILHQRPLPSLLEHIPTE